MKKLIKYKSMKSFHILYLKSSLFQHMKSNECQELLLLLNSYKNKHKFYSMGKKNEVFLKFNSFSSLDYF